mmetsp:Transcript_10300/g.35027  ORF Transcript_10300/g.35027 Transcript_10300/m.35027 type:complete len:290 (+) Transcript_10300:249-1118(+)
MRLEDGVHRALPDAAGRREALAQAVAHLPAVHGPREAPLERRGPEKADEAVRRSVVVRAGPNVRAGQVALAWPVDPGGVRPDGEAEALRVRGLHAVQHEVRPEDHRPVEERRHAHRRGPKRHKFNLPAVPGLPLRVEIHDDGEGALGGRARVVVVQREARAQALVALHLEAHSCGGPRGRAAERVRPQRPAGRAGHLVHDARYVLHEEAVEHGHGALRARVVHVQLVDAWLGQFGPSEHPLVRGHLGRRAPRLRQEAGGEVGGQEVVYHAEAVPLEGIGLLGRQRTGRR